jgi:hypothetical protein
MPEKIKLHVTGQTSAGVPTAQYRRQFCGISRKSHRNGEISEERHKERVKILYF